MIDARANPDEPRAASTPRPSPPSSPGRIALAHDWLVARRGGELVLDAIIDALTADQHEITAIYAMFDARIPITPAIDALPKRVSPLGALPGTLRRWLLFRYPAAARSLSRSLARDDAQRPIDLLVSSHSAAIKAIIPPRDVPHLCYCHTPARYLWSQTSAYAAPDLAGRLRALGLAAFAPSLRRWDRASAGSVTQFIANSAHTAAEIARRYQRDSIILHPPVRTDFFVPSGAPPTDSLLLVSALEPYKRIELAIDAAILARRPLRIVGAGSQERSLRAHARRAMRRSSAPPIEFLGPLNDEDLRSQYQRAGVFLFPQIEDFGITAVEAQACGRPVIARRAGGALDSVVEGSTGVFFENDDPESLARAIARAPTDAGAADRCRQSALRFSPARFRSGFREVVSRIR